ncbi:MAG: hypothetical protein LBI92_00270 [Azoarcus sp.]|jgi:hypothetical protein|nr:hypothetical protein [Azoarcus sp.]
MRRCRAHPRRTRGSTLLAIIVLLLLASAAALASAAHLAQRAHRHAETDAAALLAAAKTALIGYAVAYPETHPGHDAGYLPCPDTANTGSTAIGACHERGHGALGRLPYRTLGLPIPGDGANPCLWYAVSGSFKHNPKAQTLNWDSPGQFEIIDSAGRVLGGDGHSAVVALFAPGAASPGQNRPPAADTVGAQRCPGSASAAADLPAFLEPPYGIDLVGEVSIIHGLPGSGVNDIAAWLTVDEVFTAIRQRPDFSARLDGVLDAAATALRAQLDAPPPPDGSPTFLDIYAETTFANRAQGRLPAAAELGIEPAWQAIYDNWRDQLRFVACADGHACLTATLAESSVSPALAAPEHCRALVLFGGERLRGERPQRRRSEAERADPAQYLEGGNLASFTHGAGDYAGFRHYAIAAPDAPAHEDLLRCVP